MNDIIGRFRGLLLDSRKDNINELERKIGRFLTAPEMPEPPPHENLWTVTGHVRTLAEGWASPSSRYHRDPEIARHMNRLWEHAHRFIHPGCAFEGNWWGWQIGIPENLGDSLLLAADAFSPENRQSMIASLRYLVENVWDFHPGANALWAALVYVRFGLATGEENHLDLARTWVDRSCEISDWQGILKDYSYSFHGHGINLGYGALHFNYVGRFVYLMENSRWRMKEHTLGNVVNMLLEFAQWQIVGKTIDPFIIDRGISAKDDQASEIAANLIDGALLLSSGPIPRGDEVRQCCRKILDQGCLPRNPVAIELAARLQGSAVPPLYGMRYWPETEHFVARQPGWTVEPAKHCWSANGSAP
jgi:hypothetical protein